MQEQAAISVSQIHDPNIGTAAGDNLIALPVLPSIRVYLGIFLISAATLLFELALTRIFAVVLWAHMAFMVVGSALFGFGLSGVYLALTRRPSAQRASLPALALLLSLSMLGTYLVITLVPLKIWNFSEDPFNYIALALWYLACVLPFFTAGQIIARILCDYPARSSRLYGLDLIGAALGSLAMVPLISAFGGVGTLMAGALLAAATAALLSPPRPLWPKTAAAVLGLSCLIGVVYNERLLPIGFHNAKRDFGMALKKKNGLLATRWSPISRVDIARFHKGLRKVWIDAGTNESALIAWDGNMERLEPLRWQSIGAAYDLKSGSAPNVMIIGPAGGTEVMFALSHGARHVDAVELDPSIVRFLSGKPFSRFIGGLYQNERVRLINDEGRAFLRRQPKGSYDIIQFVNNYTPVAMASGALNLSETFLVTKEAFRDFFEALSPNGVLALHRGATLRVALTALAMLREKGIKHPESYLLILPGERPHFEGFYLKKSPWNQEEISRLFAFMKQLPHKGNYTPLWNPSRPDRDNFYSRVINAAPEKQREYYTSLGINLFPATDDSPFIEHYSQFGRRNLSPDTPDEFRHREARKIWGRIPKGDFPYVMILIESALLALLFIALPLGLLARGSMKTPGFAKMLAYFGCLGFGFIVVEICLMKRYVLFLGNPAYSITTILVALLLGAGLGSVFTQRLIERPFRSLMFVLPLVLLAILAEMLLAPRVFDACLHLSFAGRVTVAGAILLPLGFLMGMPFPLGLQIIQRLSRNQEVRREMGAWAWGINGYMTVVGSALTVFIALFGGFKSVLALGMLTYLAALLFAAALSRKAAA